MKLYQELFYDQLPVRIYPNPTLLGQDAAEDAATVIRQAISVKDKANIILATGNSQLTTLAALSRRGDIDWAKVTFFHMDEYTSIPAEHPSGFARFLRRKFFDKLPTQPQAFHALPIIDDPGDEQAVQAACQAYTKRLREHPADLCLLGIGENGHIAFNDPPFADFDDPAWVKPVRLAERSRLQQVGEGHFPSLAETPTHALTLTIPALLAAGKLFCLVPEKRKAEAVRLALRGPICEDLPASILRNCSKAILFLDQDSAASL